MCGGTPLFDGPEANAMAAVEIIEGLPASVIYKEDQSKNTLENAIFPKREMAGNK